MFPEALPRVAVIDSGWNSALHNVRVLGGTRVQELVDGTISYTPDTEDTLGHGTACGRRIQLMCPHALIVPVKIFHRELGATGRELLAAIRWARAMKVSQVSLSLSCSDHDVAEELEEMCDELADDGIHIVAAADNVTNLGIPAEFSSVIGVKAGADQQVAGIVFSGTQSVECTANGFPGSRQWGPGVFNSIAAATVSGFIAALQVARGRLTPPDLRILLEQLCDSESPDPFVHAHANPSDRRAIATTSASTPAR